MLPLLYQSNSARPSASSMAYLGRLTKCVKCAVSQQINGEYQLSAVFSPTDPLIGEVKNQRFLLQKPNFTDDPQYFEIYNQQISEDGQVTVTARHIKHCCYNNLLRQDVSNGEQTDTPQGHWDFLTEWDNGHGVIAFYNYFSFTSHLNSNVRVAMETGYTKSDTLGMFLEELAAKTGGEYHFDNFDITLNARLGSKKNYALRWGKNIGSPNLSLSADTVYTHVVAYADFTIKYSIDGHEYAYSVRICSDPYAIPNANSALDKIYMYDATGTFVNTTIDPTTSGAFYGAIRSILTYRAQDFVQSTLINDIQIAESANLKVAFRQPLDEMKAVGLGDTVDIFLKSGHTVEARIIKTEFDALAERWNSLEIGQERLKLADIIVKKR